MHRSLALALAASVLFLALSVLMLPYAGIQDDEVLFTTPLYLHIGKEFLVRILHRDVFLMVTSYIGALKTMLLAPVFSRLGTNPWTLRLPVALLGALTVFVFYFLAAGIAGRWAALLGAFLLATDPIFLLTNTFDWGPVALEHVLLVTGTWSLFRWARAAGAEANAKVDGKHLTLGFLCLGLALWNKAIFLWALSGLTVGALTVFPTEVRRLTTRRHLRIGAAAFLLGALPLIVYNVRHRNATLRDNAHLDLRGAVPKLVQLELALNGSSLFGYMVSEEWMPQPKPAASPAGRASAWLREHLGARRWTGFAYVLGLLIAAVPLWWRSRAARFSLVFVAVAWLAMAVTRDAGGSAHHVILLWPFPLLFAAIALARLAEFRAGKWPAAAVGVALVAMNLAVLNQYLVQFARNGPAETFTDAIDPLSDRVTVFAGRPIYVIDWGMVNVLEFLHQGRVDLSMASEPLMTDAPPEPQQKALRAMIANPAAVFLGRVAGQEMFPLVNERLDRAAQSYGFRKEVIQSIADSNGRPRFEIFRFLPEGR
ncbi:MAG TPA: glycosyltransferase family 39 protein [Bryobacteraceae bacterium]|nr:glycosyltransferase family 39 protein [Bryobacteraceae bacterium]